MGRGPAGRSPAAENGGGSAWEWTGLKVGALQEPLLLVAFCTSRSGGPGDRQYAGSVPRVPPPDRLEGALTMCLREPDKSEGLPYIRAPLPSNPIGGV